MTQKTDRVKVLELLETVFWMIVVCAVILQFACGIFIMGGKNIEILKWWYAGSLIAFSLFGILAVILTYKVRKVNVKTQRQMSNARITLVISWVNLLAIPSGFGLAILNSFLLGRTDGFALVLSPVFVFAFSMIFPALLCLETRPVKSVWE